MGSETPILTGSRHSEQIESRHRLPILKDKSVNFNNNNHFIIFYKMLIQDLFLKGYAANFLTEMFQHHNPTDLSAENLTNQILSHGCWCSRLNILSTNSNLTGGETPVDQIDSICKNWIQNRHCNDRFLLGTCYKEGDQGKTRRESLYEVTFDADDIENSSCNWDSNEAKKNKKCGRD